MNNKNILAFDTALSNSVTLILKDREETFSPKNGEILRASEIMVVIDDLLKKKNLKPDALSALALNIGPGSFTGIRIGIALTRGIARPFDIPVVPVNSFEAIVRLHILSGDTGFIITAGGGYLYYAEYKSDKNSISRGKLLHEKYIFEEIKNIEEIVMYGGRLEKPRERISSEFKDIKISDEFSPLSPMICEIADESLQGNKTSNFRDLQAYYIKPSYVDI